LIGCANHWNALVHRRVAAKAHGLQDRFIFHRNFLLTRRPIRVSLAVSIMPKRTDIHSVLIIGAGPIIIGQACEFDTPAPQPAKPSARKLPRRPHQLQPGHHHDRSGVRRPHLTSNPSRRMRGEIIIREKEEMKRLGAKGKLVLLPTLGGQTALNTAMSLHKNGALERHDVEMIGAKPDAIHKAKTVSRSRN